MDNQNLKFKKLPNTKHIYYNNDYDSYACISKSINSWTLYMEKQNEKGINHYSSHNTYDEAFNEAGRLLK